jgi:peptidyl-prolyl cis-trans isomerase D
MLQFIRDKSAGVVVKVLFLLLVVSFALWGVGDYQFLRRDQSPALSIAGEAVPVEQLRLEFQRDLDRLRRSVGDIDPDVLRQFGLATQTVERVANQGALDLTAQQLSLIVSDAVVRRRIQEDPNFLINGVFDPNAFRRLLQENGLNEARYIELMRSDAARTALIDAVSIGAGAPPTLTDRLYRHREEKRRGDAIFVPSAQMPDPGAPADADLQATYQANAERFTDPELRSGIVVRIGLDEVRGSIPLDEAQLRAEFEARKREFTVAERRAVELIRFDDLDAAKAAKTKLDGGADFLAVAKDAGQSPDDVRAIGKVTQEGLPSDLAKPLFALGVGTASEPLVTGLGTFIARVTEIEGGNEPQFEEMRDRIAEDLVRRAAGEFAYRLATRVEEGVNEGKPIQEAARAAGVAVTTVESVDPQGRDRQGAPLPVFEEAPEALRAFGEAAQGRDSGLIETRAGNYFFVRVDAVTPSQLRPFAAVRDDVVAIWQRDKRDAAARARAEEIAREWREGKDPAALAAAAGGGAPQATPTMRRDGRIDNAPQRAPAPIAARLFQLKVGEIGVASIGEGYFVLKLSEIIAADPIADASAVTRLSDNLAQSIGDEIGQQYVRALRERLRVVIDPAGVERLYQN